MPSLHPASLSAPHSARYARGAHWDYDPDAGTLSYHPARRAGQAPWTVTIGDAPGQAAQVLHLTGRFGIGGGHFAFLDHYVVVDSNRHQVGTAVRRAVIDTDPRHAWWPPKQLRPFLQDAGLPLRATVIGSVADLDARFPGLLAQDRLNTPPGKVATFLERFRK